MRIKTERMSDDKTLTKIPHFDGHYDHWSELMENLLRAKGLWNLVETGFEKPTEESVLIKDHQVKHYLYQAIDRNVFEQILDRSTSKIVWESLKKKFRGNEKVKKSLRNALRREFEILEMKKGETITDYFARVMVVSNKLRNNGDDMPDSKVVEKILRTLTDQFTYVVVSIKESKDADDIYIDELQSSLVMHEQKFNRPKVNREDEDHALKVEERTIFARGRGRGSPRGRGRGRGRFSVNKATVECFNCHKLGHFQYECPMWNREANYVELEEDDLLLMAYVGETKRKDIWFVDSGCSNHMCNNKGMFSSLDMTFSHSVKLGNNNKMEVAGKGVVKLMLGEILYIVGDVYFVPELKNNLLSVGQLQEKGLAVLFQEEACSIYHPQRGLIVKFIMSANRMFTILSEPPETRGT